MENQVQHTHRFTFVGTPSITAGSTLGENATRFAELVHGASVRASLPLFHILNQRLSFDVGHKVIKCDNPWRRRHHIDIIQVAESFWYRPEHVVQIT